MKVQITFECDNAAFEDNFSGEIRQICYQIRDKIHEQLGRIPCICTVPESADIIFDTNGNPIGKIEIRTP